MVEEWRDIDEFEGKYQVSSLGRVKSLNYMNMKKERCLNPAKNTRGYFQVNLCKNGKIYKHYVHRLVADAFIPNTENLSQVNHKDENKENNNVVNLEWISQKDNINYGTARKRTTKNMTGPKKAKPVICVETGTVFYSGKEAERQTGASNSAINACCRGKLKTTKGFHWRYAE